jgi:hypothetical protein
MRSQSFFSLALALAVGLGALAPRGAAAQPPPAAPPSPPPTAPAAPPAVKPLAESLTGMAKAEYEAGRILYADKDYGNAIVKFQRAHELSNDPRLLWNVAVCQKNLRRYAKMLDTIRRYRREAGAVLTAEEQTQATEIIKTVEAFVSAMKLTVSEPDAEVLVDDEVVAKTPVKETIILDVGIRKIRVKKPGFKDALIQREVVGGGEFSLDVVLEKEIHRGRLVVVGGPNDIITLDGKPVGKARWEGSLPSGGHQLKVTAEGMVAYQSEVVIQDDQMRRVDVALHAVPKDATKTVLWIVGGAALAAGAAVGGAFLFKPTKTTPVDGNINPHTVQLSFSYTGRW